MSKPRYAMDSTKYLNTPELRRLQATIEKYEAQEARNTTLIWLLMHTGARAQEALNIRPEDLNHHTETVMIYGLKGSNNRELPLPKWLFARLPTLAESGTVFDITYKRLFQVWNQYKPCRKSIKALRHTFAQNLYAETKDIRLVQHALGHRSISNTMVYADHHYSQTELRKQMPDYGVKGRTA